MNAQPQLRPQSRWIVQRLARDARVSEMEAERALLELIARGHVRIIPADNPQDVDTVQGIIKPMRRRR